MLNADHLMNCSVVAIRRSEWNGIELRKLTLIIIPVRVWEEKEILRCPGLVLIGIPVIVLSYYTSCERSTDVFINHSNRRTVWVVIKSIYCK